MCSHTICQSSVLSYSRMFSLLQKTKPNTNHQSSFTALTPAAGQGRSAFCLQARLFPTSQVQGPKPLAPCWPASVTLCVSGLIFAPSCGRVTAPAVHRPPPWFPSSCRWTRAVSSLRLLRTVPSEHSCTSFRVHVFHFPWTQDWEGIAGLYGNVLFTFLKCQAVFPSGGSIVSACCV